jgi:hypothetical protein
VAAVQHTFTHKQYTEYRERNIHNNKKEKQKFEVRAVAHLYEFYPGICLTTEKKAREKPQLEWKTLSYGYNVI